LNALASEAMEADAGEALPRLEVGLLTVRVGDGEFGLVLGELLEVVHLPQLARVPFTPEALVGAANLRGWIIPVLDLGLRLYGRRSRGERMVVTAARPGHEPSGLLVDAVISIVEPGEATLRALPDEAAAALHPGLAPRAVTFGERVIAVLDLDAVLTL
jgi:purine-binding chemotaxis protein CheW